MSTEEKDQVWDSLELAEGSVAILGRVMATGADLPALQREAGQLRVIAETLVKRLQEFARAERLGVKA